MLHITHLNNRYYVGTVQQIIRCTLHTPYTFTVQNSRQYWQYTTHSTHTVNVWVNWVKHAVTHCKVQVPCAVMRTGHTLLYSTLYTHAVQMMNLHSHIHHTICTYVSTIIKHMYCSAQYTVQHTTSMNCTVHNAHWAHILYCTVHNILGHTHCTSIYQ